MSQVISLNQSRGRTETEIEIETSVEDKCLHINAAKINERSSLQFCEALQKSQQVKHDILKYLTGELKNCESIINFAMDFFSKDDDSQKWIKKVADCLEWAKTLVLPSEREKIAIIQDGKYEKGAWESAVVISLLYEKIDNIEDPTELYRLSMFELGQKISVWSKLSVEMLRYSLFVTGLMVDANHWQKYDAEDVELYKAEYNL